MHIHVKCFKSTSRVKITTKELKVTWFIKHPWVNWDSPLKQAIIEKINELGNIQISKTKVK